MTVPTSSRPPPTLSSLKQLKNRIIGTPSAKWRLAQDSGMIQVLVRTTMDPEVEEEIRTETAQILGSLASLGGHMTNDAIVLTALIEGEALRGCLSALSTTRDSKLRLALTRAVSGIASNSAELVGPSQWGLGAFESGRWLAKAAAAQTLEWFFSTEAMDIWVPMLSGPSASEVGVIANMIGTVVRTQSVRERICGWKKAGERERMERRGWESKKMPGFVLKTLLELTARKDTLGNALFALAALAKDNPSLANDLPLPQFVAHAKSRSGDVQLSACLCVTHILRASPLSYASSSYIPPAAEAALSVLMTIISSNTSHSPKAAFILSHLMADSPAYSQLAFDRGALKLLLVTLRKLTYPCPTLSPLPPSISSPPSPGSFTTPEWDSWLERELDQPKVNIRLREALMLSLASISLFSNDIRRALAEDEGTNSTSDQSQPALSLILAGLVSPHTSLRYAACHVIRALTRSVAVIRTNIVDSGLGWLVFSLFMARNEARPRTTTTGLDSAEEEEDPRVTGAALRAICNAVNDFSPLKAAYLEHGLIKRLAEVIHSMPSSSSSSSLPDSDLEPERSPEPEPEPESDTEDSLRFNALWTIKNLVRKSSPSTKREVIRTLGWARSRPGEIKLRRSRLDELLNSPSSKILEQTLSIIRNLCDDEDGIGIVMDELDIRNLPRWIALSSSSSGDEVSVSGLESTLTTTTTAGSPGSMLLAHLASVLNQPYSSSSSSSSSHLTPHTHHSHPHSHVHTSTSPASSPTSQDLLIQATSILANLTNSSSLTHHRMILRTRGMVDGMKRVLQEDEGRGGAGGGGGRKMVVRAIVEMVWRDLGVGGENEEGEGVREEEEYSEAGDRGEGESQSGVGAGLEMGMDLEGAINVQREEEGADEEGDVDVFGIGYGTGMGRRSESAFMSASASASTSEPPTPTPTQTQTPMRRTTPTRTRAEGLTSAHKLFIQAGFIDTLRKIVESHQHQHHRQSHFSSSPHLSGINAHGHGQSHSPAHGGSGMHFAHAHGHGHGVHHSLSSESPSSSPSAFPSSLSVSVGSIGSGIVNLPRERESLSLEDLETARVALDWLEHGDVYAYGTFGGSTGESTYARRAGTSIGVGVGGDASGR